MATQRLPTWGSTGDMREKSLVSPHNRQSRSPLHLRWPCHVSLPAALIFKTSSTLRHSELSKRHDHRQQQMELIETHSPAFTESRVTQTLNQDTNDLIPLKSGLGFDYDVDIVASCSQIR